MITREFLEQKHPELLDSIRKEAARAECERIRLIDTVSIPGHEELVRSFVNDGRSTVADVALAVVNTLRKIPEAVPVDLVNPTLN